MSGAPDPVAAALPRRLRHASKVLSFAMLVMGACGIAYEYTLGVLGNNLMGSSHEQIFVVIGIMMFAMGFGAAFQSRLSRNLFDTFVAIEILLGLVGGGAAIATFTAFVFTPSYQVVLFGLAFLIGALIGIEIPVAIRINTEFSRSLRLNLSGILGMDYVGSLLGALLFAYVLLTRLSLGQIGLALGVANSIIGLAVLLYFWPLVVHRRALALAGLVTICLLTVALTRVDDWMETLEQRCYRDPIVHRETSTYQHLVVTRRDDRTSLWINGHLQFSSVDEHIYHELLVHPAMTLSERRERVLILGGGDGLALRDVLRYPDVRSVTLVDIDPAVTRLAATHPEFIRLNEAAFHDARVHVVTPAGLVPGETVTVQGISHLASSLLDDSRYDLADVRLVHIDADLFVRSIGEAYDVVILDFPDPKVVELAKLFSVDFYRQLVPRVRPGGLVAVQSASPFFAREVFLCVGRTLEAAGWAALPYHENVPSFGEWGWHLASAEGDVDRLRERVATLRSLSVETRFATPEILRAAFEFGKGWLDGREEIRPSTKLRPTIVGYYRQAWR